MASALKSTTLTKAYRWGGKSHEALRGVSLEVPKGAILGLIGRNGAGKTTFLRIASTSLLPTSGKMEILGHDVVDDCVAVREQIAVIPQESRPFYWMTPRELVFYYLTMRGHTQKDARARADEALGELGLGEWENTLVGRLSGGLRRRAMVAMVMASDAEMLFLDEPTTGLDPVARRSVWEAVRKAARKNRTIFLTTHYLDEAEALSSRLALLDKGQLLASGTREFISQKVKHPYRVVVEGGFTRGELEGYGDLTWLEDRWMIFTGEKEAREISRLALERGARLSLGPVSLEDIFLQIVGKDITKDETEEAEVAGA
ncbi:MAG: ABC transporter ATP-binding protein [Candidatus Thermoplasmatota archaeon]|jgi:ABC-2 type transport system ATP-binding protein|nr:ABC transporter ATP-binding protein [Candidatus Thermoplasmatota archaeon]